MANAYKALLRKALPGTIQAPQASGRQVRPADPHPVGLGRLGLVEQQVGRAALPVGRIGGAWNKELGLQRLPPVPA